MIEFNLEQALAGDKVITRNGEDVTQIAVFYTGNCELICGVINGAFSPYLQKSDLFMAPKMLSGFLNCHASGRSLTYINRDAADKYANNDREACIDLSQFPKGYGLD